LEHACEYCGINLELRQVFDVKRGLGRYGVIEYVDPGVVKKGDIQLGSVSPACGEAAFQYVIKAISLAKENEIAAIVTAPINKKAIRGICKG